MALGMSTAASWPVPVDLPVIGGEATPPDVDRLIDIVARSYGTNDRQAAATLAWKRYSYIVAAPVAMAWAHHGVAPDVGLDNVVVTINDEAPIIQVAVVEARWHNNGADIRAALEPLFADHLDPVSDRFRELGRVGRRALDALATAMSASAIGSASRADDPFGAVDRFLEMLGPGKARLVEIAELTTRDKACIPLALRSACCLLFKVEADRYCSTCNLIDDARRTQLLEADGFGWSRRTRMQPAPC